jgi:hypothetical protein
MKTIYELDDCDFECALYDYLVTQDKKVEGMTIKVSVDGEEHIEANRIVIQVITEDE